MRESAAAVLISAQLVLRDETHLFALLDGLADEKKNLLTYLFDKHGARGRRRRGEFERGEWAFAVWRTWTWEWDVGGGRGGWGCG